MVTEAYPKLRCGAGEYETFQFDNNSSSVTYTRGVLYKLGQMVGTFLNNVGTSGDVTSETYPDANSGAFVQTCPKIIVQKGTKALDIFSTGDKVFLDTTLVAASTDGGSWDCFGFALEAAGSTDTELEMKIQQF